MSYSKPQPPLPNSNSVPRLVPPPPYSEDIERAVNETSSLYSGRSLFFLRRFLSLSCSTANSVRYTVLRETTGDYQATSSSSCCKTLRTTLVFSVLAIVFTLYLHELINRRLFLGSLSWIKLTPSIQCLRYSTREYSALLRGVPNDEDGLQWCKEKEITIHGIHFKRPAHCTVDVDNSGDARVYGHWIVESNEPRCMTTWEDFSDKGCAAKGSHYRVGPFILVLLHQSEDFSKRIEAHMGNHQPPWDNWREMCSTTPMDYEGYHFDHPDRCDWSFFGGVTGVWFLKDKSC
ncbi:hypothetical protein EDD18DRAFT_1327873 [Armillaria luteobubalina]|uniref:Uncharacterized protein n=1 Tax=Armillaria luteobubalina TaxID=153913 RepID=A0AA39QI25_9AGAR|nr:hypothetical protein EDD18DRAFT_1327873 [Armillaria luteobubalina]